VLPIANQIVRRFQRRARSSEGGEVEEDRPTRGAHKSETSGSSSITEHEGSIQKATLWYPSRGWIDQGVKRPGAQGLKV